ncbi:MAG: tetratricopeptide repeat protein [Bacteroidia bacterium]
MRLFIIFFFSALVACGQQSSQTKKHKVDSSARQLNDSAVALTQTFFDSLNYVKAIALLDKATAIDSDYYIAYWNKIAFQSQIKQYDKALVTSKEMIRLKPKTPDFYQRTGILYEIVGDHISADKYFHNALALYDNILDTMKTSNKNYDMLLMSKGVNLIMLGQQQKGNDILKRLYDTQADTLYKEMTASFMNKSKTELLDTYRQNKYSH